MAREPSKGERAEAGAKSPDDLPEQAAPPDDDAIRRRAYQIWEEEGWPEGRDQEHWLKAQRELTQAANPGPQPAADEDRSRAVAPPKARKRSGASATRGRGRAKPG